MAIYLKSFTKNICDTQRKQFENHATETAEELSKSGGRRAEPRTTTTASERSEREENATSTYAIGKRTVEKLKPLENQTVHSATSYRPQGESLKFKCCTSSQNTNSVSTRLCISLNDVMNFKEILFDGETKISLFSVKTWKAEGNIGITRSIQLLPYFYSIPAQDRVSIQSRLYRQHYEIACTIKTSSFCEEETWNRKSSK